MHTSRDAAGRAETGFLPASGERKPHHSSIDVSAKRFWNLTFEEREDTFALLRERDPVSWQRPVENAVAPDPDDPGYWAVVSHAEIVRVSRDHRTFISGQGVQFDLLPPQVLEMSQSFLAMDPPRHDRLRALVSRAFTPGQVRKLHKQIGVATREVVDSFAATPGEIDFVERCSQVLPIRLFADMFGVPDSLRETVHRAAGDIVAWADPEAVGAQSPAQLQLRACTQLHEVAAELIAHRRRTPTSDLLTNLVHAEIDSVRLSDAEIAAFFVLMSVAGTDTTKHSASWALKALADFPDQREWLRADYDGRIDTALEELIRYATPVMTFRRTATTETELAGKKIIPGDKVVMFYPSGNRDRSVFLDPHRLDLSRTPNPHLGFGGGGVHFCLGSHLAKSTLRELFSQLLHRIPDFEVGEPDLLGANFMRGIKRLPCSFTPERRGRALG